MAFYPPYCCVPPGPKDIRGGKNVSIVPQIGCYDYINAAGVQNTPPATDVGLVVPKLNIQGNSDDYRVKRLRGTNGVSLDATSDPDTVIISCTCGGVQTVQNTVPTTFGLVDNADPINPKIKGLLPGNFTVITEDATNITIDVIDGIGTLVANAAPPMTAENLVINPGAPAVQIKALRGTNGVTVTSDQNTVIISKEAQTVQIPVLEMSCSGLVTNTYPVDTWVELIQGAPNQVGPFTYTSLSSSPALAMTSNGNVTSDFSPASYGIYEVAVTIAGNLTTPSVDICMAVNGDRSRYITVTTAGQYSFKGVWNCAATQNIHIAIRVNGPDPFNLGITMSVTNVKFIAMVATVST